MPMNKAWKHLRHFPLGFAAGISIGLGGLLSVTMNYLLPNIFGKILGSLLFGIGLFLVCTFSFSLYTGKVGLAIEKRCPKEDLLDLLIMLSANFIGAASFGMMVYLFTKGTPLHEAFVNVANGKLKPYVENPSFDDYLLTFSNAFFCGLCVYLSVKCFQADRLRVKGILLMFFFVFLFVFAGFEHCVANMFYYGSSFVWKVDVIINIALVVLGNSLGTIPGIYMWALKNSK